MATETEESPQEIESPSDTDELDASMAELVESEISDTEPQESTISGEHEAKNLQQILSIKVPIIVKVAQKNMKMAEILKLHIGTVIQFDQDAYQHIELMVNNSTIGLGQPVKVGENFGLKITQIGDITDTIKALQDG